MPRRPGNDEARGASRPGFSSPSQAFCRGRTTPGEIEARFSAFLDRDSTDNAGSVLTTCARRTRQGEQGERRRDRRRTSRAILPVSSKKPAAVAHFGTRLAQATGMVVRVAAFLLWSCALACDTSTHDPSIPGSLGHNDPETPPQSDAAPPDAAPVPDAAAPDAAPPIVVAPAVCASAPVESYAGTASRKVSYYPDNITATVTWQRVATEGCVDHYTPTGTAQYEFAIPGALCAQSIAPDTAAIAADHVRSSSIAPRAPRAKGTRRRPDVIGTASIRRHGQQQTFDAAGVVRRRRDVAAGTFAGSECRTNACGNGNARVP